MKRPYFKIITRLCPICQNPNAETIGFFDKYGKLIRTCGLLCLCGLEERCEYSKAEEKEIQQSLL